MANFEKDDWRKRVSNFVSYLRERISSFGLNGMDPDETLQNEDSEWSLKTWVQQKLFDHGLRELRPGETINDRQKWVRNTSKVRMQLHSSGIDDEPLEEIFESEGRKWTLRTRWRVIQFSWNLKLEFLKRRFVEIKERWADNNWTPKRVMRSVAEIKKTEPANLVAPLKESLREENRKVVRSFKEHKRVATEFFWKSLEEVRSADGRKLLWQRLIEWLHEYGLTTARIKQLGAATAVIVGLAVVGILVRFDFESQVSKDQKELALDTEITQLTDFSALNGKSALFRRGELQSRKSEIDSFRERFKVNDEQELKLKFAELDVQKRLFHVSLLAGEAEPERDELETLAQLLIDGEDAELATKASYELCVADVKQFVKTPTEANAQQVHQSLRIHQSGFLGDAERSLGLSGMLINAGNQNPENEEIGACLASLVELLKLSRNEIDVEAARKIDKFRLFAEYKLPGLENRIRFLIPGAFEELNGAVEQLKQRPDTLLSHWRNIIRASEALGSVSKTQQLEKKTLAITEIAATIPDSHPSKDAIRELLARQRKRLTAVGTQFDISGNAAFDNAPLENVSGCVLVVFVDQSTLSVQILRRMARQRDPRATPIVVFKSGTFPTQPRRIEMLSKNFLVASEKTAEKYLSQMPVDFFPQIMVLDDKGVISATNLYPVQVAKPLAALKKKVAFGSQ